MAGPAAGLIPVENDPKCILSPAPQVLQLTRFWQFSCHLLRDADGLTLIDTGLPGSATGIEKAAKTWFEVRLRSKSLHRHAQQG
jgi:hypothetical protein